MKYMLIEVMEREISEPEYFDTHDAAHDEMCRRVAEVYDISPDEVKESYLEGEDLNENAVVRTLRGLNGMVRTLTGKSSPLSEILLRR